MRVLGQPHTGDFEITYEVACFKLIAPEKYFYQKNLHQAQSLLCYLLQILPQALLARFAPRRRFGRHFVRPAIRRS